MGQAVGGLVGRGGVAEADEGLWHHILRAGIFHRSGQCIWPWISQMIAHVFSFMMLIEHLNSLRTNRSNKVYYCWLCSETQRRHLYHGMMSMFFGEEMTVEDSESFWIKINHEQITEMFITAKAALWKNCKNNLKRHEHAWMGNINHSKRCDRIQFFIVICTCGSHGFMFLNNHHSMQKLISAPPS